MLIARGFSSVRANKFKIHVLYSSDYYKSWSQRVIFARQTKRENSVQFKFSVSKNMDSWSVKQLKSGISASNATEETINKRMVTKYRIS